MVAMSLSEVRRTCQVGYLMLALHAAVGCAGALVPPAEPGLGGSAQPIILGRAVAVITGETSRKFLPAVRWIEVQHRQTDERYRILVRADDHLFRQALPAGDYVLTRVQISEGPFLSMATLSAVFPVGAEGVTFVGTWRFGVDSPRYGRMVVVSVVQDQDDRMQAESWLRTQYPEYAPLVVTAVVPDPTEAESRLYEVMPYPRYPNYFRRHLW